MGESRGTHISRESKQRGGEVELGPGDAVRLDQITPWLKLGDSHLM